MPQCLCHCAPRCLAWVAGQQLADRPICPAEKTGPSGPPHGGGSFRCHSPARTPVIAMATVPPATSRARIRRPLRTTCRQPRALANPRRVGRATKPLARRRRSRDPVAAVKPQPTREVDSTIHGQKGGGPPDQRRPPAKQDFVWACEAPAAEMKIVQLVGGRWSACGLVEGHGTSPARALFQRAPLSTRLPRPPDARVARMVVAIVVASPGRRGRRRPAPASAAEIRSHWPVRPPRQNCQRR